MWVRKIDRQRGRKEVENMLLQELRFTDRELHFRVIRVNGKEKNAKLKIENLLQICSSVFFSPVYSRFLIQNCEIA